jgi:hypothetical protein
MVLGIELRASLTQQGLYYLSYSVCPANVGYFWDRVSLCDLIWTSLHSWDDRCVPHRDGVSQIDSLLCRLSCPWTTLLPLPPKCCDGWQLCTTSAVQAGLELLGWSDPLALTAHMLRQVWPGSTTIVRPQVQLCWDCRWTTWEVDNFHGVDLPILNCCSLDFCMGNKILLFCKHYDFEYFITAKSGPTEYHIHSVTSHSLCLNSLTYTHRYLLFPWLQ